MRRFILVACLLLPAMGAWGQGTSDPMTLKFPLPVRPPPPGETPAPGRTPAEAPPPAVSRPAVAAAPAAPIAAPGAQPLTIGMLLTLSGPGAILGQHARDGFELALKQRGGRLGGRVVNLVVVDDEQKPDVAVARATRLVEQDKAEFVVGPIFSTVLGAIFRPVTGAGVILISPSAGSSAFAGKACSPNFFVTSYENSQVDQVLGQFAQSRGLKRAFVLAPDDQAGRDAVAGFKSRFKGEVLDQDLGPPAQLDFQADLARIRAAKPDVVFAFMPGESGVNLVKQFRQSGLAATIPFLSALTIDESTLPAQQIAAMGMFGGMTWAPDTGTPANRAFVSSFEAAYGYVPASYAMNGFDAAQLIDSALKATGGKVSDKEALRTALRAADFTSPRGPFQFNTNGYPVQDFYLVQVVQRADGKFATAIRQRVFNGYADEFAGECGLK